MALSQKHSGKILVPWYNCSEWKCVYDLIYNANAPGSRVEAVKILKLWKNRMPLLSSGIEGTLIVLEAVTTDVSTIPEHVVRSFYGTALMRFLNLCAANSDRQGTFYSSAKKNNIPDWIIDLRHDFAHAHDLPPLPLLTLSLNFALNWLEKEYWSVHNNDIKDWIVIEQGEEQQMKITRLFSTVCEITKKNFNNEKIELSDYNEEIVKEASDKPKIKQVLNSLINKMREDSSPMNKEAMIKSLIEKGDILNQNYLQESENDDKTSRSNLVKGLGLAWDNILKYFMEKGILLGLLKHLYQFLNNWCQGEKTKIMANLWIIEILNFLKKRKLILDNTMEYDSPKTSLTFKVSGNDIDVDIETFKDIVLSEPNKYALEFIKGLLQLCQCTEDYIESTEELIRNYTTVENTKTSETLDPVNMQECENMIKQVEQKLGIVSENINIHSNVTTNETDCNNSRKRKWTLLKDSSKYEGPLGVSIGQDRKKSCVIFNINAQSRVL